MPVEESHYTEFCTPYAGLHQVIRGDGHYQVMTALDVSLAYHGPDPV